MSTASGWAVAYAFLIVFTALTIYHAAAVPLRLWLEQRRADRPTPPRRGTAGRRLVVGELAIAAAALGLWWLAATAALIAALPGRGAS